jgi:hypothetical protein
VPTIDEAIAAITQEEVHLSLKKADDNTSRKLAIDGTKHGVPQK